MLLLSLSWAVIPKPLTMKVFATTQASNTAKLSNTFVVPIAGSNEEVLHQLGADHKLDVSWLKRDFKGEAGEVLPVYAGTKRYFLLGLGEKPAFADILRSFRILSYKWSKQLSPELIIDWTLGNVPDDLNAAADAALNGLLLGAYQLGKYKSEPADQHPLSHPDAEVCMLTDADISAALQLSQVIAETQCRIMDLVNAPSNYKLPSNLAAWVAQSGQQYAYRVETWGQDQIKAAGMHALLAVNQGSAHPAAFIIAEYKPAQAGHYPTVALVGKGVTFDTGGISIKPSTNMHLMKSDMGGAAAVFGTLEAASRLQLPVNLIGIVPSTENSIDANALKPSEVIGSYAGKTIEVIDTDAEGRLILADGLSYAVKHFNPDVLIDLATLTGSAVRTFGYVTGAMFTHNDDLADQLYQAGWQCGERLWRLPLWDLYKDDIKSDVADLRNFSGKPTAGAISAAKFLEAFVENHPAWAHLDIAGVAFTDSEVNGGKAASAYGIRLLLTYLRHLTKTA